MFPKFNFPQFWSEDDGRGHYCRNYLAKDRAKAPPFGQAAYTDLGHIGGHGESLTQVAGFEPLPYRLAGPPVRLNPSDSRPLLGAPDAWPCSRARHRRVRLACVASSTAGRHFGGRAAASSLTGVESSRQLLRELAGAQSFKDFPLARLARLPLRITEFLTAPPPPDAQDSDAGVDALGVDPLNPESLCNRMIGTVSGRHCGSGIVWASAAAATSSSAAVVAYAAGQQLDSLRVSTLDFRRSSKRRRKRRRRRDTAELCSAGGGDCWRLVTRWTSTESNDDGQIYEVVGDACGGTVGLLIAVRRKDRFQLYRQTSDAADEFSVESSIAASSPAASAASATASTTTNRLLSVSLNPHITGELVTMDADLVAKLWDPRRSDASCSWRHKFSADELAPWSPGELWASASVGPHHRSCVCVGGRLVELFDMRSPPTVSGVKLFQLPSNKNSPERFRCRIGVGPHGHLIGSDGNLRLVDVRMTGNRCLLHSKSPLHAAATAAWWLGASSDLLLLGAQTTGEVSAMTLQASDQSLPPTLASESRLLPLETSRPDGLRGLAAVHLSDPRAPPDSPDDVMVFRMTGSGGLYLQRLLPVDISVDSYASLQDVGSDYTRPVKATKLTEENTQILDSPPTGVLSFDLPPLPDAVNQIHQPMKPALNVSTMRRQPEYLPHLDIAEYASTEQQASLDSASLVLAKLWHDQDETGAARQRRIDFERQEIQRAQDEAEAAAAASTADETLETDDDIFEDAASESAA